MNSPVVNSISQKRKVILATTLTALFAALIAAGAFISIPVPFTPIPVVLQNLFVLLSGLVLGPVLGSGAVLLYLIAGAIGAPVFAGGRGGFVQFIGPTGGYLLGYLFCALCAGLLAGRPMVRTPLWRIILAVFAGILVVYIPGLLRLKAVMNTSWREIIIAGFLPFVPGDAIKGVVAVIISPRLRRLVAEQFD